MSKSPEDLLVTWRNRRRIYGDMMAKFVHDGEIDNAKHTAAMDYQLEKCIEELEKALVVPTDKMIMKAVLEQNGVTRAAVEDDLENYNFPD